MPQQDANPKESRGERVDRELMELLNELRVALPGVQVLFAFLLTVAFTPAFDRLSDTDRNVYFLAVATTAASTAFLIAPSAHHRVRFRGGAKEPLLRAATVFAIAGLAFLTIAMSAVLYLVTDVVYRSTVAAVVAGGFGIAVGVLWFVLPLTYRARSEHEPDDHPSPPARTPEVNQWSTPSPPVSSSASSRTLWSTAPPRRSTSTGERSAPRSACACRCRTAPWPMPRS